MDRQPSQPDAIYACRADELAPGQMKRLPVSPPIVVYNIDGEFFATSDLCSHDCSSLSEEGYIDGEEIECGWHYARFCIKTGAVTAPPATRPLDRYHVTVRDGEVVVALLPSLSTPTSTA